MNGLSRRDILRAFFGQRRQAVESDEKDPTKAAEDQIALILDRFCLAYQGGFCSVCSEHCPQPGAIVVSQGKPRIEPDACTGCEKCRDVCPAPRNAVFLVARKPRQGMVGRDSHADPKQS